MATILTVTNSTKSPVTIGSDVKFVDAKKRTTAVKITGNAIANSIVGGINSDSIYGGTGNDSLHGNIGNDKIYGDAGNDVLDGGAGNDSLAGGAGNDSYTGGAENDYFFYSAGKDVITDYATGDTIKITSGKISKATLSGSDVIFTVGTGLLTVKNAKGKSLAMIDSAGKSFSTILGAATPKTLNVELAKSPVTIDSTFKNVNATKRKTAIKITGNTLDNSISGGTQSDSIYGGDGNDTVLGNNGNDKLYGQNGNDVLSGGAGNDSLAGGSGNDTFTGGAGNDYFFYGGGKDVITDYATGDKIKISSGKISKASVSGSDVIFTVGTGSLTVKNAKGKSLAMIDSAGKSFSTILGDATASTLMTVTNSTKSPVTIGSAVKTVNATKRTTAVKITGNAQNNSISGGSGADSIYGGAGNDSILGNAGNDKLYGEAGNDVLSGGAGNDSLAGGSGNDTFTGGAGNDYFFYSGGKDIITDYATGDTIKISSGKISKASVSGSDVVFTVGSGTLTVKNAKGKSLAMIDSAGKTFSTILGGSTNSTLMTVTNSTKSPVTIGTDIKIVNASSRTSAVKITGNAQNNSIVGGSGADSIYGGAGNDSIVGNAGNDKLYGEAGNDVLSGGAGNDSLAGGKGNDLFIYSAGKDVITDYASGDKISICAAISNSSVSGSDMVFTIGNGLLTVKNGKGKSINLVDTDGNTLKDYELTQTVYEIALNGLKKFISDYESGKIQAALTNADYNQSVNADSATLASSPDAIDALNILDIFANTNNAAKSTVNSVQNRNKKTSAQRTNQDMDALSNWVGVADSVLGFIGKEIPGLGLVSSMIGLGASVIAISDGVDPGEMDAIVTGVIDTVGEGVKAGVVAAGVFFPPFAPLSMMLSVPFGPIDMAVAATKTSYLTSDLSEGLVTDFDKTFLSEYTNDLSEVFASMSDNAKNNFDDKMSEVASTGGTAQIPTNAFEYNGHSYYVYSGVVNTWEAAKSYCESRGGHLAVITTANENTALFNYVQSKGYGNAYFGLSDAKKEGTWTWVTGERVSYTNWGEDNEPNGGTYENYGMFYSTAYPDGKWNDGDFIDAWTSGGGKAFICEWDTTSKLASSADIVEDYWFMNETASSGDLDSLMGELPATNNSVTEIPTDEANNPNKLLRTVTLAQAAGAT